jgi:transketolase
MATTSGVARGAYILAEGPDGKPYMIPIGTAARSGRALQCATGLRPITSRRVVSMPFWELLEE